MGRIPVNKALQQAQSHIRRGEFEEARNLYQAVLQKFPNNSRARNELNKLDQRGATTAVEMAPPQAVLNELAELYKRGEFAEVAQIAARLVNEFPGVFLLWNLLGVAYRRLGKPNDAVVAFTEALSLRPDDPSIHFNLGNVHRDQGAIDKAIQAYSQAVRIRPDFTDAHMNLGVALKEKGNLDAAVASYRQALKLQPDHAELRSNLGNTLKDQGKFSEALREHRIALKLDADNVDALVNMGVSYKEQRRLNEAIRAFSKALALQPNHVGARTNLGNAFKAQGKLGEAVDAFTRALAVNPAFMEAHFGLGNALKEQGKLDQALAAYSKALAIKPENAELLSQKLHLQAHMCDFTAFDRIAEMRANGDELDEVEPFSLLFAEDNPELQKLRATNWVRKNCFIGSLRAEAGHYDHSDRIRVGYFGADFKDHPVSYLLVRMLELQDRERFEVHAFSFARTRQSNIRDRIAGAVDFFHEVTDLNDAEVVKLAQDKGIDVAIDLMGHTKGKRMGLFAQCVAPVQINYLGFPGTSGAEFMDYIIADDVLIPEELEGFYTEQVIRLPGTYMPTDNTREISGKPLQRHDFGLPDDGFVLCCFNNNYKITPDVFDIWMRVLRGVEDSVLWLRESNEWSADNLRREAECRGVSGDRLVFAGRVPMEEHLARHRLADLFVDTFNFNAHTTASEALWAGLPVVSKIGDQFAARVAASLLTAVGLPELITTTNEEYETCILELAQDPSALTAVREKLAENRWTQPLFDSEGYTRAFEAALEHALRAPRSGNQPRPYLE